MDLTNILGLGGTGLLALLLLRKYVGSPDHPPYPPGPKAYPVIGNVLDIPTERFVLTWSKMGEKYGPITWLVVPGRTIIVLNTYEVINELLEKQGSNFIDRPLGVMLGDLIGMGFITPLLPANATWRLHRKLLRTALSLDTIKRDYHDLFLDNASSYVTSLVLQPSAFLGIFKRTLGETIALLTYGAFKDDQGNDYVAKHEELLVYSKKASAGYVVDALPVLKYVPSWFPGAQFQRDAKTWGKHLQDLRDLMVAGVEKRMAANEGQTCYVVNMLKELRRHHVETGADIKDDVEAVYDTAFSFYQAAEDTTEIVFKNFLLAMTLYPEIQKRAADELSRVVGRDRLPNFQDQPDLPYLQAVVLESLRWNPPAPILVPHQSREDIVYNGYFIPKGTMAIPNAWQMSRDPNVYENPSVFNPDRFVETPKLLDPRNFAFGFGRRACPGSYMAYQIVWIFCASVLWGFEMARPEGEPTLDRDEDRFDFEFLSAPNPFKCDFTPRKGVAERTY